MQNQDAILEKMKKIKLPGGAGDLVETGVLRQVQVTEKGAEVTLLFNAETAKFQRVVEAQIKNGLRALGIEKVEIHAEGGTPQEIPVVQQQPQQASQQPQQQAPEKLVPEVRHVIAVASGKGGVGKSTVSVNLACALAKLGFSVGILDTDVYGPNIPMMFGLEGKRPGVVDNKVMPLERDGLKIMSLGFLAPSEEAIIWRGPLVGRAIEQMLRDVAWGELDYLILDLPPGTGDAQLTISQRLKLSGAVLVSTPQAVALSDALKGLKMFQKVEVPVLGLIENMSTFICDSCDKEHDIFGKGGVKKAAHHEKLPFLGEIPITPQLRSGGDQGTPMVLHDPESVVAKRFMQIAETLSTALDAKEDKKSNFFGF